MIITRTPFRVSFFGGGSDLPDFYIHSPGAVLSLTINYYIYILSHKYFDPHKLHLKYSQNELVDSVNELKHPIFRTVLQRFGIRGGLECVSVADIPAGTGLGSSSSFTVGLLHNMYARFGRFVTADQLAKEACDIELNELNKPIGKQDQYAAAHGGLCLYEFKTDHRVTTERLHLRAGIMESLEKRLLMFYTGQTRTTESVLNEQKKNIVSKEECFSTQKNMVDLVWKARDALYNGELDAFGLLLDHTWRLKKTLTHNITNPTFDEIYQHALKNGALGGKLLGAGGGGFFLFYCRDHERERLCQAMSFMQQLPFKYDHEGSKLISVVNE